MVKIFNNIFKNFPTKYIYAGYTVRKGLTTITTSIDGKIIYDVILYSYIDDYLSFYCLMEDGKYKNMKENVKVDLLTADQLISKHLERGDNVKLDKYHEYLEYDKQKPYGVFGLHTIPELLKMEEEQARAENKDIPMAVLGGEKAAYTGLEVDGILRTFNQMHNSQKKSLIIPPIKNSSTDTMDSPIGEELDFYDFVSNKTSEEIVAAIKGINEEADALGNKKYETLGL